MVASTVAPTAGLMAPLLADQTDPQRADLTVVHWAALWGDPRVDSTVEPTAVHWALPSVAKRAEPRAVRLAAYSVVLKAVTTEWRMVA